MQRVKTTTERMRKGLLVGAVLTPALFLMPSSCIYDAYDGEEATEYSGETVDVQMNIQTYSLSDITSTQEDYQVGTAWENYIDMAGGDYRIYFFTYDPLTETEAGKGVNSTLIAEFAPTAIYTTDTDTYTTYTLSGVIEESLISSLTNFKVVVIANWGTYPTVTAGTTTIDDICTAQTAVFDAFVDSAGNALMPSSTLRIPFYGVREYSGVTWRANSMTRLDGDITLLRALAKVEVVLENTDVTFTEININNYNATGYCAPKEVYLRSDYDHNYTWASDFVDGLHLVNGSNDSDQSGRTIAMYRTTNSDGQETWVGYIPEYDNSGDDYCYISAKFNYQTSTEEPNPIYFANYTDGAAANAADYDIYRNYLYRFHVTLEGTVLQVHVNKWENTYENDFRYGGTTYN